MKNIKETLKSIYKHYLFNYLIAGIQLIVLVNCIHDYTTTKEISRLLFDLFFGMIIFVSFIQNLITGILEQFKEWANTHTFNFNKTDNNKTN